MKKQLLLIPVLIGVIISSFFGGDLRASDALQGGIRPVTNLTIIAIDNKTISYYGEYPIPRRAYAELFNNLMGNNITAVGLDIGFFNNSPYDKELLASVNDLEESGTKVVFAGDESKNIPPFPVNKASSELPLDPDGVVRHVKIKNSFPFKVSKAVMPIILPKEDTVIIRYFGKPGSVKKISLLDLILNNETLTQGIVLIGATDPLLHDEYMTPVSRGLMMSGVEIHANIIMMILSHSYIYDIKNFDRVLLLVLFSLIGTIFTYYVLIIIKKPSIIISSLIIVPIYYFITALFFDRGVLLPPITPMIAFFLSIASTATLWVFQEQKKKRELKRVLEKYLAQEVINEIIKNPETLSLGGSRREITILFSDIRGFTSLSEDQDPEEITKFLNEYLTIMTRVIHEYKGVVDKFIGDAIMAFWNAPLKQKNHVDLSCKAALKMIRERRKLSRDINIGIGINTGTAVVGNLGSEDRFDYTAIGDSVNLASRLEGLTKYYGVNVIISDTTASYTKRPKRLLDKVIVKGRSKPIKIYELIPKLLDKHKTFEEALELYWQGNFVKAKKLFIKVNDNPSKIFLKRMNLMKEPPRGWDGVWRFDKK